MTIFVLPLLFTWLMGGENPPPISSHWSGKGFWWSDLVLKSECKQKIPQYAFATAWICASLWFSLHHLHQQHGLSVCPLSCSLGCPKSFIGFPLSFFRHWPLWKPSYLSRLQPSGHPWLFLCFCWYYSATASQSSLSAWLENHLFYVDSAPVVPLGFDSISH